MGRSSRPVAGQIRLIGLLRRWLRAGRGPVSNKRYRNSAESAGTDRADGARRDGKLSPDVCGILEVLLERNDLNPHPGADRGNDQPVGQ